MLHKKQFHHESLQDKKTIQDMLKALAKGIGKGQVSLTDEDGEIVMSPEGLLKLKLKASEDNNTNKINLSITWQSEDKAPIKNKSIIIGDDNN
ncbi:amphi-Trp domain-containing protein [Algibacillus agarilyticus]|uniref:amphi-Trp domain-containing protein n=1 Tax=Algibacillus agarilyticus TaxID=2234133 RepID=UPI000DD041E8|nr:amphi-Trp domain-containing protein [Algibacillus agarilyticus]